MVGRWKWDAVAQTLLKDQSGNSVVGRDIIDTGQNIAIHLEFLVTRGIGCKDIIVTTADAVLVVKKSSTESVKALMEHLKAMGIAEADPASPLS